MITIIVPQRAAMVWVLVVLGLAIGAVGPAAAQSNRARADLMGTTPSADTLIEAFTIRPEPAPDDPVAVSPAETSVLLNVTFAINSARLDADGAVLVRALAAAMNSPRLITERFMIEGHTDLSGPFDFNLRLSRARAETVLNRLVKAGVAPQRLSHVGFGPTRLLPDLPPKHSKHRRVEVVLDR